VISCGLAVRCRRELEKDFGLSFVDGVEEMPRNADEEIQILELNTISKRGLQQQEVLVVLCQI
jgi:hypothetical protein